MIYFKFNKDNNIYKYTWSSNISINMTFGNIVGRRNKFAPFKPRDTHLALSYINKNLNQFYIMEKIIFSNKLANLYNNSFYQLPLGRLLRRKNVANALCQNPPVSLNLTPFPSSLNRLETDKYFKQKLTTYLFYYDYYFVKMYYMIMQSPN